MSRIKVLSLSALLLGLVACQEDSGSATDLAGQSAATTAALVQIQPPDPATPLPAEGACVDLQSQDAIIVGQVCATISGDNLQLVYTASAGGTLKETRTWVDTETSDPPLNPAGNLQMQAFPVVHTGLGATTDTIRFPLDAFIQNAAQQNCAPLTLYIVNYAKIKPALGGTVMAYNVGTEFLGENNIGLRWHSIVLECRAEERKTLRCASAFAHGGDLAIAFNTLDSQPANRWGWTNGPLYNGDYEFTFYAHAARNDLEKGEALGGLSVTVQDDSVFMDFGKKTDGPEVWLVASQFYVGSTPLPLTRKGAYTAAPGQYGHHETFDTVATASLRLGGFTAPVYVVNKAVVCVDE